MFLWKKNAEIPTILPAEQFEVLHPREFVCFAPSGVPLLMKTGKYERTVQYATML